MRVRVRVRVRVRSYFEFREDLLKKPILVIIHFSLSINFPPLSILFFLSISLLNFLFPFFKCPLLIFSFFFCNDRFFSLQSKKETARRERDEQRAAAIAAGTPPPTKRKRARVLSEQQLMREHNAQLRGAANTNNASSTSLTPTFTSKPTSFSSSPSYPFSKAATPAPASLPSSSPSYPISKAASNTPSKSRTPPVGRDIESEEEDDDSDSDFVQKPKKKKSTDPSLTPTHTPSLTTTNKTALKHTFTPLTPTQPDSAGGASMTLSEKQERQRAETRRAIAQAEADVADALNHIVAPSSTTKEGEAEEYVDSENDSLYEDNKQLDDEGDNDDEDEEEEVDERELLEIALRRRRRKILRRTYSHPLADPGKHILFYYYSVNMS